jgi:hypothetical protein
MSHIVSRMPWGVIELDPKLGRVLFRQDWHYDWTLASSALRPWTYAQQRNVHNRVDRHVWGTWNNRIRLQVAGSTDFCRHFYKSGVALTFDVRWVTSAGHWSVKVRKLPLGSSPTTRINSMSFDARQLELDTAELASYQTRDVRDPQPQKGHNIDEVGLEIRTRYMPSILGEVNRMLDGATFSAPSNLP